MNITVRNTSIAPMTEWLRTARETGVRDEKALRRIFEHEDYQIEFARYGLPDLPVCGISREEAVSFFLHFDEPERITNERLRYKLPSFLKYWERIGTGDDPAAMASSLTEADMDCVKEILRGALPADTFAELEDIAIILTVSVGNSQGWPWDGAIAFDVSNFDVIESREAFLHIIAHEIHHVCFAGLIPEDMTAQEYLLVSFAFEGLAVHFCNNQSTLYKPARYPGPAFCMCAEDMARYESRFGAWMDLIREDWLALRGGTIGDANTLLSEHYMNFTPHAPGEEAPARVSQFPTYYFGCLLWGALDAVLGREEMYRVLKEPSGFVPKFNEAITALGGEEYAFPTGCDRQEGAADENS